MRLTLLGLAATMLTALGLHPVLQGSWWFWASLACATAAVAGATIGRLLGLPRPVVPIAGFLGLLVALTQFSAPGTAVLGVFPGPGAVREYVDLMHKAFHYVDVSVPPAPNKAALVALVAGGVGLVALLVDTCAVTYRAAALAGLPLLALYGVPVAVVRDGVAWPYFALGALGWMALLLAEGHERVGSWGRAVRRSPDDTIAKPMVGRRIGAAALGLAIIVPALLPGVGDGIVDAHRSSSGEGGGRVLTVNPLVSIGASLSQPDNAVALDYKTTSSTPGYLTLVTLDRFDGTTWIPSTLTTSGPVATHQLPDLEVQGVTTAEVETQLHADGLKKSTWLPTPTPLLGVTADDNWVYDDNHRIPWSPNANISDQRWTARSLELDPTVKQLQDAPPAPLDIQTRYLALPGGINPAVEKLARSLTNDAPTELDKALALQTFFRTTFNYDAGYRSPKNDPLGAFLTARKGFCQQFATTFAVMARQLGLPTRVVVGFLPGHRANPSQADSRWTVYWRDTHAWPEVYFTGFGWVRFEPTPRTDNPGLTLPVYAFPTSTNFANPASSLFQSSRGPKDLPSAGANTGSTGTTSWWSPGHLVSTLPWPWLGGVVLVLLLLAAPALVRYRLRRRRLDRAAAGDPVVAAMAAWEELEATCVDLGVDWPDSRTPRQTAADLRPEVSMTVAPALARLGLATERAQYSRAPGKTDDLDVDVAAVRIALLERRTRGQRLRADVLPRSVLSRVGSTAADVLDRVDDAVSAHPFRRGRD